MSRQSEPASIKLCLVSGDLCKYEKNQYRATFHVGMSFPVDVYYQGNSNEDWIPFRNIEPCAEFATITDLAYKWKFLKSAGLLEASEPLWTYARGVKNQIFKGSDFDVNCSHPVVVTIIGDSGITDGNNGIICFESNSYNQVNRTQYMYIMMYSKCHAFSSQASVRCKERCDVILNTSGRIPITLNQMNL